MSDVRCDDVICCRHLKRVSVSDKICSDPAAMIGRIKVCANCAAVLAPCTENLLVLAGQKEVPSSLEIEAAMKADGWYMDGDIALLKEPD